MVATATLPSALDVVQREKLAIVWTREKRCTAPKWQLTPPFIELHPHDAAEHWRRMRDSGYEPAITLRTSGLVGIECDGPEDAQVVKAMLGEIQARPRIIETRPDKPGRAHLYFGAPRVLGDEDDVSFRVEGGVVTGAVNNYYRCLGGDDYQLSRYTPDAPALAESQYQRLVEWERASERRLTTALRAGEPIDEGSRRCTAFRLACLLFRWTSDEALVADLVDVWNQATCKPVLAYGQVVQQVRGAYRIASREGRLGCELDDYLTKKQRRLTPQGAAFAISELTRSLAKKWAPPAVAAEIATRWYEGL